MHGKQTALDAVDLRVPEGAVYMHYPAWDHAFAAHLIGVFGIRLERKVGTLSKGESRRLQFVLALAHRAPLLPLNKPADGLEPVGCNGCAEGDGEAHGTGAQRGLGVRWPRHRSRSRAAAWPPHSETLRVSGRRPFTPRDW